LEEAGLVRIDKKFVNKRPNTVIEITAQGKSAIENHWRQLETLRKNSQIWKPE
jgi:DNA-binding PadR family transcriptional regulator